MFVPAISSGLLGLIAINRVLRSECPWDRKQTHHTLVTHLIEEAYETADAGLSSIDAPHGEPDFGAYAEVEEELGDLLLQVLFHATLAAEAGAFDIDEVAESIRRKLVHRHPHVFSDTESLTRMRSLPTGNRSRRQRRIERASWTTYPVACQALPGR